MAWQASGGCCTATWPVGPLSVGDDFTQLMAQHPHTAVLLLQGLVVRVRQLETRLREVAAH